MTPATMLRTLCVLCCAFTLGSCTLPHDSRYPVNSHDSTPVDEREDGNAYAGIADRTSIVAFEYGRCETNADCAPRGCDHSVCAPKGLQSTCIQDAVGECLAELPSDLCGCTDEGVCRWTRNNQVMECATIPMEKAGSRAYDGADENATYPWRPYD